MENNTVLVTAYAKAPQSTVMYELNKSIGVVLEIDKISHKIVDADIMFVTDLAKDFFKRKVIGTDFSNDISKTIKSIEEDLLIPSQQSVIVALKIANQRYMMNLCKANHSIEKGGITNEKCCNSRQP